MLGMFEYEFGNFICFEFRSLHAPGTCWVSADFFVSSANQLCKNCNEDLNSKLLVTSPCAYQFLAIYQYEVEQPCLAHRDGETQ